MASYTGIWNVCRIRYGREAKVRSARSVVIPAATAASEYSPSREAISESDFTMCVEERCTIVTEAAPRSHSAAQMSNAELLDPTTTARLPLYRSGPGCAEEWCRSPRKESAPGISGT